MSKRTEEVQEAYENRKRDCDLCILLKKKHKVRVLFGDGYVVENEYPYCEFDGREVLAHKLFIARDHDFIPPCDTPTARLGNLFPDHTIVIKPEADRSIPGHDHWHLLKLGDKIV